MGTGRKKRTKSSGLDRTRYCAGIGVLFVLEVTLWASLLGPVRNLPFCCREGLLVEGKEPGP